MKRWLFLPVALVAIFYIGNASAEDGQRLLTLNAKQIFLFVEEIQHENLLDVINQDPQDQEPPKCDILPTGIEVLDLILNQKLMISADKGCNYPEPKYDNCKVDCKRRYPVIKPRDTNLRPRQICFGACIANCTP